MTTTEIRRGSTYPPAVADLVPKARELAARLGELPSRNRLMRELRVGAAKASAVRAELAGTVQRPAEVDPPTVPIPQPPAETPPSVFPASDEATPDTAHREPAGELPATDPPVKPSELRPVARPVRAWPVLLLALPAFVAIWSGWVGLGTLTGFGVVHPLPGIWDGLAVDTAITLPIGMETYAAVALRAWLSGSVAARARRFAKWSAMGALALGAAGQVAYHLMTAAGMTAAPWQITTVVACLPVAVLGMGAALAHLVRDSEPESTPESAEVSR